MLDLPKQTIRVCDGTLDLSKPAKGERWKKGAQKKAKEKAERAEIEKSAGVVKRLERKPIGAKLRAMVLDRDGRKCVMCGKTAKDKHADGSPVTLEVDHILPVAQGGTNCESNLRTACNKCNLGRGARKDIDTKF